jgi:Cytochrome b involved in lipid metabolism
MIQTLLLLIVLLCHHHDHVRSFTLPTILKQQGTSHRMASFTRLPTSLASISFQKGRQKDLDVSNIQDAPLNRFDKTAASDTAVDTPCILTIQGKQYNMTAWAKSHPGGSKILEKFHDRDATKAFFAAGHSQYAIDMLSSFVIEEDNVTKTPTTETIQNALETVGSYKMSPADEKNGVLSRVRSKLFTKEDPIGIHKYCGIFVLLHFAYRFLQSFFGDPAAGMGNRMGKGSSVVALVCIIPHTILSLSSLIFHTVPRERIVGRPMIWQEFRAHNIIFGVRSIACTVLGWLAVYKPEWRRVSVIGSSASVLAALWAADVATEKLRENDNESTTATMPYVS